MHRADAVDSSPGRWFTAVLHRREAAQAGCGRSRSRMGSMAATDDSARIRGLLDLARVIRADEPLPAKLDRIAATVARSLGFGAVSISLHRPAWDDFEVAVLHGPAQPDALELRLDGADGRPLGMLAVDRPVRRGRARGAGGIRGTCRSGDRVGARGRRRSALPGRTRADARRLVTARRLALGRLRAERRLRGRPRRARLRPRGRRARRPGRRPLPPRGRRRRRPGARGSPARGSDRCARRHLRPRLRGRGLLPAAPRGGAGARRRGADLVRVVAERSRRARVEPALARRPLAQRVRRRRGLHLGRRPARSPASRAPAPAGAAAAGEPGRRRARSRLPLRGAPHGGGAARLDARRLACRDHALRRRRPRPRLERRCAPDVRPSRCGGDRRGAAVDPGRDPAELPRALRTVRRARPGPRGGLPRPSRRRHDDRRPHHLGPGAQRRRRDDRCRHGDRGHHRATPRGRRPATAATRSSRRSTRRRSS